MLIREHMLALNMGAPAQRRLVARVGRDLLPSLLTVRLADILAHSADQVRNSLDEYESFVERLDETLAEGGSFDLSELAVDGNDIIEATGVRPGPLVGEILQQLWDEVLDNPRHNQRGYLLERAKRILKQDSR